MYNTSSEQKATHAAAAAAAAEYAIAIPQHSAWMTGSLLSSPLFPFPPPLFRLLTLPFPLIIPTALLGFRGRDE